MRNSNALVTIPLLLLAAPCFAQQATGNVKPDAGLAHDLRPFGKYLVEICTLSGEKRTLTCDRTPLAEKTARNDVKTPLAATPQKNDQTITLKLACDPAAKGPCNAPYPLVAGTNFFVSATADSGLTVQQQVLSGSATPVGGNGTVQYRANAPGLLIIRATVAVDDASIFRPAAPVDLLLQVVADAEDAAPACAVLPPPAPAQNTPWMPPPSSPCWETRRLSCSRRKVQIQSPSIPPASPRVTTKILFSSRFRAASPRWRDVPPPLLVSRQRPPSPSPSN